MKEAFSLGHSPIRQFTQEEMRSNAELPRIGGDEVLAGDPVLQWLTRGIGFGNWRQVVTLVVSITMPFLAFALAASQEKRFLLKSLLSARQIGQDTFLVPGMSFLGDPMVWPFFILVPLAILLLKNASKKFADFFYEVRAVINPAWANTNAELYGELLAEARGRLSGRGPWRWAPRLAAGTAVLFWMWNFFACSFPSVYPYQAAYVYVQSGGELKKAEEAKLEALPAAERTIAKWDANLSEAPWSWGLARLWAIFGYGVIPFVLARLISMVVALYYFCRGLIRSEALNIQPLAADRSGGLSCLADAALAIIYTLLPILLMVFAAFFKEGTLPSAHNYLLMASFLPIIMIAFALPISTVHTAMERTKRSYLTRISHRFNVINQELLQHLEGKPDREHIQTLDRSIQTLQGLYQQIEKMPVWPFELGRGLRFAGALLAPVVLTLVQIAAKPYIERLMAG